MATPWSKLSYLTFYLPADVWVTLTLHHSQHCFIRNLRDVGRGSGDIGLDHGFGILWLWRIQQSPFLCSIMVSGGARCCLGVLKADTSLASTSRNDLEERENWSMQEEMGIIEKEKVRQGPFGVCVLLQNRRRGGAMEGGTGEVPPEALYS